MRSDGSTAIQILSKQHHNGSIAGISASPFVKDLFLSVADWSACIWKIGTSVRDAKNEFFPTYSAETINIIPVHSSLLYCWQVVLFCLISALTV